MSDALLDIRNLSVALPKGADRPFAVQGVTLDVKPREILCIVGESGSGKSVLTATLMGAAPKGLSVASGEALMAGQDLLTLSERQWQKIRGKEIGMIFQEPMASLNPPSRSRARSKRSLSSIPICRRRIAPARRGVWSRQCICPNPTAS